MLARFSALILLTWSVIAWPWWLTVFFILFFIFWFDEYYEAVFPTFIFDIFNSHQGAIPFFLSLSTLLLVLFSFYAKKRIVFYR